MWQTESSHLHLLFNRWLFRWLARLLARFFGSFRVRLAVVVEVPHCREDEVFELLAGLNELLAQPEVLNRAYAMLRELEVETLQKLACLVQIEDEPVASTEDSDIIEQVKQLVNDTSSETAADRLAELLTPNQPTAEMAGLKKMAVRLQTLMSALE